jgi:hypothetical protein
MSRLAILIGGLALVAASTSAATAQSPVRFWIEVYHGQWADSPRQTKTVQVELSDVAKVNSLCASPTSLRKTVAHFQRTDVYLQTRHIHGAACVKDKAGNIKIAAGQSSVGSN